MLTAAKPHLMIVGISWPPETFIARRIRSLTDAGFQVTVCSASVSTNGTAAIAGVRLLPLPAHTSMVALLAFALPLLLLKLRTNRRDTVRTWREARKISGSLKWTLIHFARLLPFVGEQPDIIHYEWNSAAIDHLPLFNLLPCPAVISCRGAQIQIRPHLPDQQDFVRKLRITLEKAAAVHCVSDAIQREAAAYGLDPAKAWVIRPAVDPNVFRPSENTPEADGVVRLVTTGSLIWRKGYEYALLAIRFLKDRGYDVCLQIIGDGPERQRILYTVHDLDLVNEVELMGRLRPEQVVQALQNADIFLLSSLSEGISNAALEAMSCALPVVTTDCGGMCEAITDGIEGLVVPVRNPEAMANALERLITDRVLRRKLGDAARRRILRDFTLEQQTAAFLTLYQAIRTQNVHEAAVV